MTNLTTKYVSIYWKKKIYQINNFVNVMVI